MKAQVPKNLFFLGIFAMASCSPTDEHQELRTEILNRAVKFPAASVAVAYKNLATNDSLCINERVMMHAASTMKVPVMIEVFKQAQAGKFGLDDAMVVRNRFSSIVDGTPYAMDIGEDSDEAIYSRLGHKMTIRDLTHQMITVSSNLATNLLIGLVGAENVTESMRALGANDIQVLRGVEDLKAYRAGLNNETSAYDLMRILEALACKGVVTGEACEAMIGILLEQQFRDKIPAGVPEGVRVANKTGNITEIDHDCAIVYPPDAPAYVLVVLTSGIEDHAEAQRLIADISARVYHFHKKKST